MELRLKLALFTGPDPLQPQGETSSSSSSSSGLGLALQHQTRESAISTTTTSTSMNDEVIKDGFVVGWPPVKSWRKQLCHHNRRLRLCATNHVRGRNWMYVKVKMDGVGITRKIDLSSHRSHRTLATKLLSLFGKCEENEQYKLMYLNKEGEWLQARDVTWECFIKSVQRLKLEKN